MNYRLARELDVCVYDRGDRQSVCVCIGDTLKVAKSARADRK